MTPFFAGFLRKRYAFLVAVPVLLLVVCLTYLGVLQLTGNFHEVVPGEFYRSAQLNDARIRHASKQYHIASIINLRGENTGNPWYDEEVRAAERYHVAHYDFRMSSTRGLDERGAAELLRMMQAAPKPLLIHCQAGADRTGLAAALYLAAKGTMDVEVAEEQLSPWYGHLSLPIIGRPQMDLTFERMEPIFKGKKQWAMGTGADRRG